MTIARLPLKSFIDEYWSPLPGQHTTMVGPNGCGKTTVGLKLLAKATELNPQIRGVALVMKPHSGPRYARKRTGDPTVAKLTKELGGVIVRNWPPPATGGLWRTITRQPKHPAFYVFWPKHSMDPDQDDAMLNRELRACLRDCYKRGGVWVFCDEVAGLTDDLDLEPEVKAIAQRGRSIDAGGMFATQRPRNVPRPIFTEGKHFFLWRMSDDAEYERLREIGGSGLGVDRKEIVGILSRLGKHECLYINPDNRVVAVLT